MERLSNRSRFISLSHPKYTLVLFNLCNGSVQIYGVLILSGLFGHFGFNPFSAYTIPEPPSAKQISSRRLSRPLIGDDGKVYACSEKDLLAFESNGSIAWTLHLKYTCKFDVPPIHGGKRKEVFLRTEPTKEGDGEIVGLAVSTVSSSMYVNIRHRGLFAYMTRGQLLWIAGPVIDRYGYQQGCRKNNADCYFNSVPVIDQCDVRIKGELIVVIEIT